MLEAEFSDAGDALGGSLKSKLSVVLLCPHAHMEEIRYRVTTISDFAGRCTNFLRAVSSDTES
jgi:hypothetical protein